VRKKKKEKKGGGGGSGAPVELGIGRVPVLGTGIPFAGPAPRAEAPRLRSSRTKREGKERGSKALVYDVPVAGEKRHLNLCAAGPEEGGRKKREKGDGARDWPYLFECHLIHDFSGGGVFFPAFVEREGKRGGEKKGGEEEKDEHFPYPSRSPLIDRSSCKKEGI